MDRADLLVYNLPVDLTRNMGWQMYAFYHITNLPKLPLPAALHLLTYSIQAHLHHSLRID
jgi:hypothetical protein